MVYGKRKGLGCGVSRRWVGLALAASVILGRLPSEAADLPAPQVTTTPPPAPAASNSGPGQVQADPRGFVLQSADGAHSLRLRATLQAVGRLYVHDSEKLGDDGLLLRRVRPALVARLYRQFELRLQPDFAGGRVELLDAVIAWRPIDEVGVRFGKTKTPTSFERLQAPAATMFLERAWPSAVAPNRDVLLTVFGTAAGGILDYEAGVANGAADGANADSNVADRVDLVGRVWVRPGARSQSAALKGLTVGASFTWGQQRGTASAPDLSGYRSVGGRRFFNFRSGADGTTVARGPRLRVLGAVAWNVGGLGLLGEYIRASHAVALGAAEGTVTTQAWAASARYIFGAAATWEHVEPARPVGQGGPGALELRARVEGLSVENAVAAFAGPDNSESAWAAGGGTTWWLNRNARLMLDFHHTGFRTPTSGTERPAENVLLTTTQVSF